MGNQDVKELRDKLKEVQEELDYYIVEGDTIPAEVVDLAMDNDWTIVKAYNHILDRKNQAIALMEDNADWNSEKSERHLESRKSDSKTSLKIADNDNLTVSKLFNNWVDLVRGSESLVIKASEVADVLEEEGMMSEEGLKRFNEITRGCVLTNVELGGKCDDNH